MATASDPARVLILGGTAEAMALARLVAADPDFALELSLAGRTAAPKLEPGIPTRIGGFGGVIGLADYLARTGATVLIDATHPFAARIRTNAQIAATLLGLALIRLERPAWEAVPGDRWQATASIEAAAAALGETPRRVFLAIGRLGLETFAHHRQHDYVARTIDPPAPGISLPPRLTLIADRGPFSVANERALLARHSIDVVVAKNSGGEGAGAKLTAARELGLPVILVARPPPGAGFGAAPPAGITVASAPAAYAQLRRLHEALSMTGGMKRSV